MSEVQLTKRSIVIPFSRELDDGTAENLCAYIRTPGDKELAALARTLGFLYSKFSSAIREGFSPEVLMADWRIYLEEFLGDDDKGKKQRSTLEAFFERRLSMADIFNVDTGEVIKELDDYTYESLKGTLLFLVSLSRYAPQSFRMRGMKNFITSLNFMDYKTYAKKLLEEQQAAEREKEVEVKTETM